MIRLDAKLRKEQILEAATQIAIKCGYQNIKLSAVAYEAKIAPGLMYFYFNNIAALKKSVLKKAIADKQFNIISQAIVNKDPLVENLCDALKKQALQFVLK